MLDTNRTRSCIFVGSKARRPRRTRERRGRVEDVNALDANRQIADERAEQKLRNRWGEVLALKPVHVVEDGDAVAARVARLEHSVDRVECHAAHLLARAPVAHVVVPQAPDQHGGALLVDHPVGRDDHLGLEQTPELRVAAREQRRVVEGESMGRAPAAVRARNAPPRAPRRASTRGIWPAARRGPRPLLPRAQRAARRPTRRRPTSKILRISLRSFRYERCADLTQDCSVLVTILLLVWWCFLVGWRCSPSVGA